MAGATTCPECGARVSAFAAGCAKCGADLELHARQQRLAAAQAPTARGPRLPRPALPRPDLSVPEGAFLAITVFSAFFVSVLGIVLGLIGVMHGVYEDKRWLAALFGALALVAAAKELLAL